MTSTTRRRLAVTIPTATLALALGALPAAGHATCSDVGLGVEVHGHHVVRDYVAGTLETWPPSGGVGAAVAGTGAVLPGGPGPAFHFELGFAPGASFCNDQARSGGRNGT